MENTTYPLLQDFFFFFPGAGGKQHFTFSPYSWLGKMIDETKMLTYFVGIVTQLFFLMLLNGRQAHGSLYFRTGQQEEKIKKLTAHVLLLGLVMCFTCL